MLNLPHGLGGRFQRYESSVVAQGDILLGLRRTSSGMWIGGALSQKTGSGRSQALIRKTFQQGMPQLLEGFKQMLDTFLVSIPNLVPNKQMNGQRGE